MTTWNELQKEYGELAKGNGISIHCLWMRVKNGMNPELAATTPIKSRKYNAEYYKYQDIAVANDIHRTTYRNRVIRKGMDYEQAATAPIQRKGKPSKKLNHIYAIYEGENIKFDGYPQECADYLGIKLETFLEYTTPSAQKRAENRKNKNKAQIIVDLGPDDE